MGIDKAACKNCHVYKRHSSINGFCRLSGPSWNGKHPTSADNVKPGEYHDWTGGSSVWPSVDADDWCGAFKFNDSSGWTKKVP